MRLKRHMLSLAAAGLESSGGSPEGPNALREGGKEAFPRSSRLPEGSNPSLEGGKETFPLFNGSQEGFNGSS